MHTFTQQAHVYLILTGKLSLARIYTSPVRGAMTARNALTVMLGKTNIVAVWRHDNGMGRGLHRDWRRDGLPGETPRTLLHDKN